MQVQKPPYRPDGFDANRHGTRKLGIKFSHGIAFVHERFTNSRQIELLLAVV